MSCGCLLWGICSALFACTSSVATSLPIWAMAGAGLALIVPNSQSLIADYYNSESRGRAFGVMHFAASGGALVGALLATNIGECSLLTVIEINMVLIKKTAILIFPCSFYWRFGLSSRLAHCLS